MNDIEYKANNIALVWYDGRYTEDEAMRSAELQEIPKELVLQYFSEHYHKAEAASNGY